jgi:hypothetical protein
MNGDDEAAATGIWTVCGPCGCVVADAAAHQQFHETIAALVPQEGGG